MKELFEDSESFDLVKVIDASRQVPLEELSKQLSKLAESVQDELFELINHDFAKFQEILRNVCDVKLEDLKGFREQVVEVKNANEKSYNEFKEYYETLKAKYERVQYVKRKLQLNTDLRKANNYLARFSLLKETPLSDISPFELEIACLNYLWTARFLSESQSATEIDFQLLLGELSAFSEGLQALLEEKLIFDLRNGQNVNLLAELCLKLNKLSIFESFFRFVMLEEPLNQLLNDSVNASTHTFIDFPRLLDKIFALIDSLFQNWKPLIDTLYKDSRYKFTVRALLGPTLSWLQDSVSSVFVPSKLPEFMTNFTAALAFVSKLEESFFEFSDEVAYFRAHSAWSSFMKKWALHQYFQLQLRQTISPIEAILVKPLDIVNDPKLLEQTVHCLNALKQLWSPTNLLTPLIPKVLKTSIQLVRRFLFFCREDASAFSNPAVFSLCCLQKRFNVLQFNRLLKETVLPSMRNALESLESGLSQKITENFNAEIGASVKSIEESLLPGVEQIYERLLITAPTKQSLDQLSFKALLLLLPTSKFDFRPPQEALSASLQRILIKVNRAVFKLHDQLGPQSLAFFPQKMVELEAEAAQLGRDNLASEEFWIEIKETIAQ